MVSCATCVYIYIHTYMHIYIHICIYVYIYLYIYMLTDGQLRYLRLYCWVLRAPQCVWECRFVCVCRREGLEWHVNECAYTPQYV